MGKFKYFSACFASSFRAPDLSHQNAAGGILVCVWYLTNHQLLFRAVLLLQLHSKNKLDENDNFDQAEVKAIAGIV